MFFLAFYFHFILIQALIAGITEVLDSAKLLIKAKKALADILNRYDDPIDQSEAFILTIDQSAASLTVSAPP